MSPAKLGMIPPRLLAIMVEYAARLRLRVYACRERGALGIPTHLLFAKSWQYSDEYEPVEEITRDNLHHFTWSCANENRRDHVQGCAPDGQVSVLPARAGLPRGR